MWFDVTQVSLLGQSTSSLILNERPQRVGENPQDFKLLYYWLSVGDYSPLGIGGRLKSTGSPEPEASCWFGLDLQATPHRLQLRPLLMERLSQPLPTIVEKRPASCLPNSRMNDTAQFMQPIILCIPCPTLPGLDEFSLTDKFFM